MKKYIIFTLAVTTLILSACEKNISPSQVPDSVKKTFEAKYASPSDVQWEQSGKEYHAEFKFNGKDIEAEFDSEGKFLDED